MPRKPRELIENGIYHVYNRGNNRQRLFWDDEDFLKYLNLLKELKDKFSIKIFHYCLMSNHVHLLIQISTHESLHQFMHGLQLKYTRYYKDKYKFVGHLYQGRYRSPRISEESYYLQCGRYIERNPVKARMVQFAENYRYSSAKYYACGESNDLLTENLYYGQMGRNDEERREGYRWFLKIDEPYADMIDEALNRV
jgi:putative transposase